VLCYKGKGVCVVWFVRLLGYDVLESAGKWGSGARVSRGELEESEKVTELVSE